MNCIWCGSPNLRNSRLRASDLGHLPLLRFPVRCRSCEERFFIGPLKAWRLHVAAKARHVERQRRQSATQHPN